MLRHSIRQANWFENMSVEDLHPYQDTDKRHFQSVWWLGLHFMQQSHSEISEKSRRNKRAREVDKKRPTIVTTTFSSWSQLRELL